MDWDSMIKNIAQRQQLTRMHKAELISKEAHDRALTWLMPEQNWRQALNLFLLGLGVLQLLAGVVFFFAHNWASLHHLFKLGLIEAGLLTSLIFAYRQGVNSRAGAGLLFAASTFTGVLFAVFGQIYQTGADVHTLFANWAALTLAGVLVARSSLLWVQWFFIAVTALVLWWLQIGEPTLGIHEQVLLLCLALLFAVVALWAEHEHQGHLPHTGLGRLRVLWWAVMSAFLISPNTTLLTEILKRDDEYALIGAGLLALAAMTWSYWRDRRQEDGFPRLCLSALYTTYLITVCIGNLIWELRDLPSGVAELTTGLLILAALTLVTKWLAHQKSQLPGVHHD